VHAETGALARTLPPPKASGQTGGDEPDEQYKAVTTDIPQLLLSHPIGLPTARATSVPTNRGPNAENTEQPSHCKPSGRLQNEMGVSR